MKRTAAPLDAVRSFAQEFFEPLDKTDCPRLASADTSRERYDGMMEKQTRAEREKQFSRFS